MLKKECRSDPALLNVFVMRVCVGSNPTCDIPLQHNWLPANFTDHIPTILKDPVAHASHSLASSCHRDCVFPAWIYPGQLLSTNSLRGERCRRESCATRVHLLYLRAWQHHRVHDRGSIYRPHRFIAHAPAVCLAVCTDCGGV